MAHGLLQLVDGGLLQLEAMTAQHGEAVALQVIWIAQDREQIRVAHIWNIGQTLREGCRQGVG